MGLIRKLDRHLVNQIAAGEVVERPASVVKELVENAVDAEARRIEVAVESGGKKLIRVQDDGTGIEPEDLPLAVSSHATSKLESADDLHRIGTLGFRGEALPSIGSISQMEITSRRPDSVEAWQLRVEGGQVTEPRVAGGPPGTAVEVRNLFFNVPARRKFLKTDATELGHVVDTVAAVALAYPRVGVRLEHNGRLVHDLPGTDSVRERIGAFFGGDLAEKLIEVETTSPAGRLWGLVAPPSETRASTKMQYLFLNGRYVRDRSLLHAIRESYRGLVESGRQPIVFLYLTVPPEDVDVNVHPTKIEVRLRTGQQLYREVLSTLRERFLSADLTPRFGKPRDAHGGDADQRADRVRQSVADFFRMHPADRQDRFGYQPGGRSQGGGFGAGQGGAVGSPAGEPSGSADGADAYGSHDHASAGMASGQGAGAAAGQGPGEGMGIAAGAGADGAGHVGDGETADEQGPPLRFLQVHNTYLVAETSDGMLIVDQHALHERVLYEDIRRRLTEGRLESQRMLLPETMDVTDAEMAVLEAHREGMARLGVEFEAFAARTIGIQAFPTMLGGKARPETVLRDVLEWAAEHDGPPEPADLLDHLAHRMACHAAVKAGDPLEPEEIRDLLAKRDLVLQTATCPHGRPTSVLLPTTEIERQFKRDYRTTRPQDDDTIPF